VTTSVSPREWAAALVMALALVAPATLGFLGCRGPKLRTGLELLTQGRPVPPEILAACQLAAHRCSRCHPLERVDLAKVSSPEHWGNYVDRMRRQPASGISEADAHVIVRCLVYRTFGPEGIQTIDTKGVQP
jgi:hypothetical protein